MISGFLRLLLANRAGLVAENLALRQELAVLQRSVKRPKLRRGDRVFWVWLSRVTGREVTIRRPQLTRDGACAAIRPTRADGRSVASASGA